MKRSAGILLAVSSLPSKYGIGCFDESAYAFVDWLSAAGQSYWQILPLNPTSFGDSPYQSFSAFAGNPYFISLDTLVKQGLLTRQECCSAADDAFVDYGRLYSQRYSILKKAFERSGVDEKITRFAAENDWLEDYALFMAVKDSFGGAPLGAWDEDIRLRKPEAVKRYTEKLSESIGFHKFLQYHFYAQWQQLKDYANSRGVKIIGDIPIYAALDSADVWAAPELFQLDERLVPTAVAGCPPDGFTPDGQLWGNPLYDWNYHRKTGYAWWLKRLSHCFKLYDTVRIDHFRGFDEYYSIPYGEKTARNGEWKKGCGSELFDTARSKLGEKEIIAEDLGFMTDTVRQLVQHCGYPNMKILQFGFYSEEGSDNLPHNYSENCTVYTGTHDNQTIVGWLKSVSEDVRHTARAYMCDFYTPEEQLYKSMISLLMRSRAALCVIPMQDWLGLDDGSRMNTPSTVGCNWKWRMQKKHLTAQLCAEIFAVTKRYGRTHNTENI